MAADDHLQLNVRYEPDRVVMCLHGELDLVSAQLLEQEIQNTNIDSRPTVVLDLDDVEFMDSTGLRAILSAKEHLRELGRELAVTRGSPQVQRLLSVTNVSEHLRVIESSDDTLV